MEVIFFLLLLCSNANAEIVKQNSNGGLSKSASDSAYFNIPTEASAATLTGPLTLSGSSLTVTGSSMTVAGRIGIGLLTPANKLHISDTGNALETIRFSAKNGGAEGSEYGFMDYSSAGSTELRIGNKYGGAISAVNAGVTTLSASQTGVTVPLGSFSVGGSTLVVSGGKVGVGTTAPITNLQIAYSTTTVSDGIYSGLTLTNSNGTTGTTAGILFGESLAANGGKQYIGGVRTGGSGVGDIVFALSTVADANPVKLTDEKMRITSGGNVGINNTIPADKLDISSGTIRLAGTGAPTVGYALCLMASGQLGHCTAVTAADGSCSCTYP